MSEAVCSPSVLQPQALDEKTTAKIMKEAREQQDDLEAEENVLFGSARAGTRQVFVAPIMVNYHVSSRPQCAWTAFSLPGPRICDRQ